MWPLLMLSGFHCTSSLLEIVAKLIVIVLVILNSTKTSVQCTMCRCDIHLTLFWHLLFPLWLYHTKWTMKENRTKKTLTNLSFEFIFRDFFLILCFLALWLGCLCTINFYFFLFFITMPVIWFNRMFSVKP